MENIKRLITDKKLINEGDVVGVAVSGGKDSMALLDYLHNISREMDFEVVGITVDHGLREESATDAMFVMDYCKTKRIRAYKFKVDVNSIAKAQAISIESAAREARYGVFESLVKKGIVDKIALAHHTSDQAETIFLHLLRGSGIAGIKGMTAERSSVYIRPMLETSQNAVKSYVLQNDIPVVEDKTNAESEFTRNYLRNEVMPLITSRWPNAVNAILNFARLASVDDDFINKQVITDAFIVKEKAVSIPLTYFLFHPAITTRMLFKAFAMIDVNKDIESKHIDLILELVKNGENGKKLELPLRVSVVKEYDYLTITNKHKEEIKLDEPFKTGTFEIANFGKITIKRVTKITADNALYIDAKKVPKSASWRFRENGDYFEKFGGGTKKLKSYLIDKKVPQRIRASLPVLADSDEVYVIAGVEISNKIRVDENTKTICRIELKTY